MLLIFMRFSGKKKKQACARTRYVYIVHTLIEVRIFLSYRETIVPRGGISTFSFLFFGISLFSRSKKKIKPQL